MKNVKAGHAKPIVCLDAGHYGKYNRSPVVPAYYESVMNWALHNYLARELEVRGIQVKKTRAAQAKDLALNARGKAAAGCDLFISLHSNASGTESVDRVEAIYLVDDDCGAIDEQSRQVATLLAETVREIMQTKDKAKTYSLAASFDRDKDGKLDDEYYGVLRGCHEVGTAGIILEHSFHTNTRATKWLMQDENLQALAKAEAATIAAWFDLDQGSSEKPAAPAPGAEKAPAKLDPAKSFHKYKAGVYKVQSSDGCLNLRAGAAADKQLIETMANGSRVRCYGYHTGDWLYVVSESGKPGFCHSAYLKKE